jgi:2,4-dienoyl-CoA reductase-like NADH-dependent reductase (Old Yellow Enzyme family)
VDVWDISCWRESRRGYFGTDVYLSDWVRRFSDRPRIVAGNLQTPADTADYLADDHAEGAALAKALIADAAWVNKAREGRPETILPIPADPSDLNHALHRGEDPGA